MKYNRDIMRVFRVALAVLAWLPLCAQNQVRLRVDATDAPRRLFHVQMTIPARPGAMTLLYPEWIPGEHGPTGPIVNLVGLKIQAGGQPVAWRRDSVNMYAFHIEVPAGASSVDATFDFISPPEEGGFSSGSSTTSELAVLNWNQLVLYPAGRAGRQPAIPGHSARAQLVAIRNRAADRARIRQ